MPNPSNKSPLPAAEAKGYPIDRPAQIRPGVRYAEADAPWTGKNSVPAPDDMTARHGEIADYTQMAGEVEARKFMKDSKK